MNQDSDETRVETGLSCGTTVCRRCSVDPRFCPCASPDIVPLMVAFADEVRTVLIAADLDQPRHIKLADRLLEVFERYGPAIFHPGIAAELSQPEGNYVVRVSVPLRKRKLHDLSALFEAIAEAAHGWEERTLATDQQQDWNIAVDGRTERPEGQE